MQLRTLSRFVSMIPKLEARERLGESIAAAFPHVDKKSRDRMFKAWMKQAGVSEEPKMTMDHLREQLKGQPLEGVLDVATMTIKKPKPEK